MSEAIDALAEYDTDIFANLVEDLVKRMRANEALVEGFAKQFEVEVETLGCVAEQVGRIDSLATMDWVLFLSEEDYEQFSRYIFNSVLIFVEDFDLDYPKEFMLECLEEEKFKVKALEVRGHEGLGSIKNILSNCENKLGSKE